MCDKAVNRCFWHLFISMIGIKLNKYVTVVSKDPFMLVDWSDRYKTQRTCKEAVDDCLLP